MKKILSENEYFRTSEMSLIATLQCLGYSVESIEKNPSGKSIFCIRKDKNLESLVRQYWEQQVKIEPIAFFNSIKLIKSRLYDKS